MAELHIRKATAEDLPRLLQIYEYARGFMRRTGNPNQWAAGGPTEEKLRGDIANDELYVIEETAEAMRTETAEKADGAGAAKAVENADADAEGSEGASCRIHAGFMLRIGEDPTYRVIYGGAWISDEPYGVIHRIAGDGMIHGVLDMVVRFAEERITHLRIDTHADNKVMQGAILKCGFRKCGIIYLADGSPRLAYEKVSEAAQ